MSWLPHWVKSIITTKEVIPMCSDGITEGALHDEEQTPGYLFAVLNTMRSSNKVHKLYYDLQLARAATNHARYVARTGNTTHVQPGCVDTSERVYSAGYRWERVAEFILVDGDPDSKSSVCDVLARLEHEPQLAETIFSRVYDDIGVGVVSTEKGRRVWCIILGLRLPESRAAVPYIMPFCPPAMTVWSNRALEKLAV